MSNFLNFVRYIPKSAAIYAAVILALVSSVLVSADDNTFIEGDIRVKNVTASSTLYTESTTASDSDTVRFKVWYHNTELATSAKVAENLSIKVDFPTTPATMQDVGVTIKGDNTNWVYDSSTVYFGSENARLEYIPGTAKWQHNAGTREDIQYEFVNLSDSIVTNGTFVVLENQEPCFEYEAWVYFDAKVIVEEEPETPIYECTSLIAEPSKITAGQKVTFTVNSKIDGGATISKYVYDFGDKTDKLSTSNHTVSYVYDKAGKYDANVTIFFNVNDEQKEDNCATLVTVTDKPAVKPTDELPNTGIAGVAAGFFGTGALTLSARSWLESRAMIRAGSLKKEQ
jgi:hypothetical protein